MSTNIDPFGTTSSEASPDLAVTKAFGCTVIDFNVSADWSSQAGSLNLNLIEDDSDNDRVVIPVLGTPHLFELKDTSGNVLFEHIGLVETFRRSASNSKKYSVSLTSPLTILNATQVIMDGFAGLGGSLEANADLSGTSYYNFGHNNSLITVDASPGTYHWHNVSNLINVMGILENDHPNYSVPFDSAGNAYGDFGFSGKSSDGIPLIKLMWALHMGINHLPFLNAAQRQRTHGGNLLFGRHNYNVIRSAEGIPYYYHFDAIGFYNQVVAASASIGPQFRVGGASKSLKDIVSEICSEANLEFFCYIDINNTAGIGGPTLQEDDPNWTSSAICNWPLNINKFTNGGRYGGTIRVKVINKNSFVNINRPFSNIAYNLIGLEVPDLKDAYWVDPSGNKIYPGKRPVNNTDYGLASSSNTTYSDPLDSRGLDFANEGFTNDGSDIFLGTESIASGGSFPVATGFWDSGKLSDLKIKNSDISIKLNDVTTMKVVTGGYQTRLITVPRTHLRQYWGDLIVPNASDPRETANSATDSLGLNETSSRKVPVVTPILDPRDVDDYILIDMRSDFADLTVDGVFKNGVYAASMMEVRTAMTGKGSWDTFFNDYKKRKLRNLRKHFFPKCWTPDEGDSGPTREEKEKSTENINKCEGLGYAGCCHVLELGNMFATNLTLQSIVAETADPSGEPRTCLTPSGVIDVPTYTESGFKECSGGVPVYEEISKTGHCPTFLTCSFAEATIKEHILPLIYEKVKTIGDTHYGKSWYAPAPYLKTIEDLNGENLVGNFKRSWELTDSAYVEPSLYYARQIPQSNMFINDGKVSAFVNYDHNFVRGGLGWDEEYAADVESLFNGVNLKAFNFSEYSLDSLCTTKYGSHSILHASPSDVGSQYNFLPYGYDSIYSRALLPFSSILKGHRRYIAEIKTESGIGPTGIERSGVLDSSKHDASFNLNRGQCDPPLCSGDIVDGIPPSGYYAYSGIIGIPLETEPRWLKSVVPSLLSLNYEDNGRFCFPFVRFSTDRVFLPQVKPGLAKGKGLSNIPSADAFRRFVGASAANIGNLDGCDDWTNSYIAASQRAKQPKITSNQIVNNLQPFKICVAPKSVNYAQVSTRYVYGPWMTSIPYIAFRGKIEYEQDESLVPENFLIPMGFGAFGSYSLSQTSGLAGMNLAAQGRANSIDNFALFAIEEGSFSVPGAPAITRIGDGLYGLQQVTDVRINVSSDNIETTYSFKTISPRFGKNNRDIEKNITKISNKLKKLKLR